MVQLQARSKSGLILEKHFIPKLLGILWKEVLIRSKVSFNFWLSQESAEAFNGRLISIEQQLFSLESNTSTTTISPSVSSKWQTLFVPLPMNQTVPRGLLKTNWGFQRILSIFLRQSWIYKYCSPSVPSKFIELRKNRLGIYVRSQELT